MEKRDSFIGLAGFLLLIVAIGMGIWKYGGVSDSLNKMKLSSLIDTDNSKKIVIGLDNYLGYAVLNSKSLRREASIVLKEDQADYSARFNSLVKGDLDMAVMPIHDYLEQLALKELPEDKKPLIIAAVSESRGADAVVSNSKYPNINSLKDVRSLKSAFTSPFMIKSMAIDVNLPALLKADPVSNIEDTYNGLISGKYDVVGLWEPFITKAENKGFKILMGSDELKLGKIVDVFVINRNFLVDNPELVEKFLVKYFEASQKYSVNGKDLIDDIALSGELKREEIISSLKKIKFYSLSDNVYTLFHTNSMSKDKILDYIDAIAIKLKKMNIIDENPILNGDPRNAVYDKGLRTVFNSIENIPLPKKEEKIYEKLDSGVWEKLIKDPKFTRDDLKITFLRNGALNGSAKKVLDDFSSNSIKNFDYYIAIVGRSGKVTGLSEDELVKRTGLKAQRVYDYLVKYWGIDSNRIHPIGLGSKGVLELRDGENYYKYLNSNNKVELLFVEF
jgi:hypothetical protein